jgi:restriction endonuclease S subunit
MTATAYPMACLVHIADVRVGYSIRTRGSSLDGGPVRAVQPRNIEAGPVINLTHTDYINPKRLDPAQLLRDGDLVFRTRGSSFNAACYADDGKATIAAAPLVVIRPKADTLNSRYLQWFLNHSPVAQAALTRKSAGAVIAAIRLSDVAALEVPVPPVATQATIVRAAELVERERAILDRLGELTEIRGHGALAEAAVRHHRSETP